jgi:hypothetical protein
MRMSKVGELFEIEKYKVGEQSPRIGEGYQKRVPEN